MITASCLGRKGRLGNQLFQYAFLHAQTVRASTTAFLNADAPGFTLDVYQIRRDPHVNLVGSRDYQELYASEIRETRSEAGFALDTGLLDAPSDHCDYDGYFQSALYFRDSPRELTEFLQLDRTILTKRAHEYEEEIAGGGLSAVGVHIRRGDYLLNPSCHTNLHDTDYYSDALGSVRRVLGDDFDVYVFSDDPRWCSSQPIFSPNRRDVRIVDGFAGPVDLYLMSLCDHHVIANSSFSWWAAWLGGGQRDHLVVAPRRWFGPKGPEAFSTIFCQDWVTV